MLDELTASNLGLIASGHLDFDRGLTVISGETGTGKTLMLGALRLLLGDKAGKSIIGPNGDVCEVSARFVHGDETTVLRRRIDERRSRAYIDDAAATLTGLSEATAATVAIVGQHDQHRLTSTKGVRALLDRTLGADGASAKAEYDSAWGSYRSILAEATELDVDPKALEREKDMLAFQISEIEAAAIDPGEDEALAELVQRLRIAAGLRQELDRLLVLLGDEEAGARLDEALRLLQRASTIDPAFGELAERLAGAIDTVSDIAGSTAVRLSDAEDDPSELDAIEDRLAQLGQLKRKYGDTIDDIVAFLHQARGRLAAIDDLLGRAGTIEDRLAEAQASVDAAAATLRAHRARAAREVAEAARSHLTELGFGNPMVSIVVEEAPPSRSGADTATVLFASDASLDAAPISRIASGGELSRLVLALTLGAGTADVDVIAFDEIDAGIGGNTALAMGRKLAELATDRQVLCVTHLPQVAAFAARHYTVERTATRATIRSVEGPDRVAELTRMLSGLPESEKGREHAEELLALAGSRDRVV